MFYSKKLKDTTSNTECHAGISGKCYSHSIDLNVMIDSGHIDIIFSMDLEDGRKYLSVQQERFK